MAIVTVMFTDIVGSTSLLDQLGDDPYERRRRAHFAALEAQAAAHDGLVVKNLGDGLMVVFDSVSNAVACAVASQQAVARDGRRHEVAMGMRIGLDVGEPTLEDGDYFGTPVVVAKRLCDAANDGEILVSGLVKDLASRRDDHAFSPGVERLLKGFAEPVLSFSVDWRPSADVATELPPGLAAGPARLFVGRQVESELLRGLWKKAAAGEPHTALVGGEPGVGKSTLAGHLATEVVEAGGTVLYGRCDEDLGVSYQPFVECLRGLMAGLDDVALKALVGKDVAVVARLLPEIVDRIGTVESPALAEAEAERLRLFEVIAACFEAASQHAPLLVVLDDLHWATAPTLLLLRHVVRSASRASMLIVGTYRHTEVGSAHGLADLLADLRREPSVTRVLLQGLDEGDVADYLRASTGDELDAASSRLAALLHAQTQGNPFFVGEMLAHLAESGELARSGAEGAAGQGLDPTKAGLPEGVREVIGRRVGRLPEPAQQVLTLASMIGIAFTLPVIEAVVDPSIIAVEHVLDHLEEAIAAGLLIESERGYAFAHALIRQAIHDEVSTIRRARLHRRIGEVLEAQPLTDERVDALAFHFREAAASAETTKALTYAIEAARRANDRFAFEEAVATLEAAVELVDPRNGDDLELVSGLHLVLSDTQAMVGDIEASVLAAFAAAGAAKRAGSAELLARAVVCFHREGVITAGGLIPGLVDLGHDALAALGDSSPTLRSQVLSTLGRYYFGGERNSTIANELADEAVALARSSGDSLTLARALSVAALVSRGPSGIQGQLALLEELAPLAVAAGDIFPWEDALAGMAFCYLSIGDLAKHDEAIAALETVADERRSWSTLANALACRAGRAVMAGDFAGADQLADEALATAPNDNDFIIVWGVLHLLTAFERGELDELLPLLEQAVVDNPNLEAFAVYLAMVRATLGHHTEALATVEAMASDERLGDLPRDSLFATTLALMAEVCGLVETASPVIAHIRPALEQFSGSLLVVAYSGACLGAVDRYLGILEGLLGHPAEAADYFERALALEGQVESEVLMGHTRYWYGRTLATAEASGSSAGVGAPASTTVLASALETARRLGMGTLERRVLALEPAAR